MKKKTKKKRGLSASVIAFLIGLIGILLLGLLYFFTNQQKCANSISCIKDLSGKYDSKAKEAVFLGKRMSVPTLDIIGDEKLQKSFVLGQSSGLNKHIYIDLTNQRLYAFEGKSLVYSFLISSGKWGRTPTGEFIIWVKLRYTTMSGGDPAIGTYYSLPNVPYVMFFSNDQVPKSRGFSLHGTYWHNNFGHPMSHGCVNMRIEDIAKLYYWASPPIEGNTTYATSDNPGTPITIYGEAPIE